MIDINVWLAMTWDGHPQHGPAAGWYSGLGDESLLFCRFTMLGFLRLLTNSKVMGESTATLFAALQLYDRWTQDPRIELAPEPRGAETSFRQALAAFGAQPAAKAVADCYLIGFAEAAGASIVTFDRAMAAASQSRRVPAVLLEPRRVRSPKA